MSSLSTTTGNFSLGILWLAFLGGVLVNIMPCVLPVLGLKLLGLSILENFDAARVRKKVVYVCWGILLSFVVLAVVISVLKYMGYSIGWGMQFQNEYFLVALIWCVVLFLAYVWGLVGFGRSSVVSNLLEKMMSKTEMFDVLSGVVLVALSRSCIAPYWGEAFSVALAGNIGQIVATIVFAGLGFAMPQILLLIYPGFVCHIAKMSRFWNRFNLVIFGLLVATIVWLVSILVAQSNLSLVWHWACYVVAVLVLLGFRKLYLTAVDDVKDEKIAVMLYRRYNRNFVLVILALVVVSFVDAAVAVKKRHEFIENNLEQKINLSEIEQKVRFGYKILVKVGADWCLTCKYNEALVFDVEHVKSEIEKAGVEVVDVDWTNYQPEVLDFMKKFNRIGVPFYVLYSKKYPSGLVLPEMMSAYDLTDILRK
jgi:suppressor for copper-sensitivity B